MGAVRVSQSSGVVGVYDIVGQYSLTASGFVRHCALSLASQAFAAGDLLAIPYVDMGPPLSDPKDAQSKSVQIVGGIKLTVDERARMKLFVDELWNEYQDAGVSPLAQYCIHPHVDESTAEPAVRRYSCVGFVYEAYLDADIELVNVNNLPDVSVDLLVLAYPDQESALRRARVRTKFNLAGNGPWPVMLPGYVFHAADRDPTLCRLTPHQAIGGHECFPTKS
jgi:hypothetical protein